MNSRCYLFRVITSFKTFQHITDHLIEENLYVTGTLAGWRSQFAIASGSGAHVATDILTIWNNGKHVKIHDKVAV